MEERSIIVRRTPGTKEFGVKIVIDNMEYGCIDAGEQIRIALDKQSHSMYGLLQGRNKITGNVKSVMKYHLADIPATDSDLHYKLQVIFDAFQLKLSSIQVKCTQEMQEKNDDVYIEERSGKNVDEAEMNCNYISKVWGQFAIIIAITCVITFLLTAFR